MQVRFCLILALLCCAAFAAGTETPGDTTYHDFFAFKDMPFDVHIRQLPDQFKLSLSGRKLAVHIDSSSLAKTTIASIVLDSFDTAGSNSGSDSLPLDFTSEAYRTKCLLLLVNHLIPAGAATKDLLVLMQNDKALSESLNQSYQRLKEHHLSSIALKKEAELSVKYREEVHTLNTAHRFTVDSLLNIIDIVDEENRYGGQFELVDKDSVGVPVYYFNRRNDSSGYKKITNSHKSKSFMQRMFKFLAKKGEDSSYSLRVLDTTKVKFYTNSVVIKTFNNFIDQLLVNGKVLYNNKTYPVRFYNGTYSIPLRDLFIRSQSLPFTFDTRFDTSYKPFLAKPPKNYHYYINVSDLISVNAYKKHFTFMVKNDSYMLSRRDSIFTVPYERRSFYDYLNVTTFLDFLGVQEKTPNSLIQIEGRMRLPLKLTNSRFLRSNANIFFPRIDTYLNAAFVNGSQDDSRFGSIFNRSKVSSQLDTLLIDNFDLLRKYNIRTGVELGLYKREYKNSNLNLYIDYGLHFWRTSLRYVIVDSTALDQQERFNAWSWTHGPVVRFEFRPDQNIGADFSFAANFQQHLINTDNDNLKVYELSGPLNRNTFSNGNAFVDLISGKRRTNYKAEMNVYFMINPARSNGGLYFKLSNYFNYNFKQLFPQVLVGYATRLNGLVKNIRNKAE